jgi:tetratricopeptide (TPR) repeat protein
MPSPDALAADAVKAAEAGDFQAAAEAFAAAIQASDSDAALREQLAQCLMELERYDEAIEAAAAATVLDPLVRPATRWGGHRDWGWLRDRRAQGWGGCVGRGAHGPGRRAGAVNSISSRQSDRNRNIPLSRRCAVCPASPQNCPGVSGFCSGPTHG